MILREVAVGAALACVLMWISFGADAAHADLTSYRIVTAPNNGLYPPVGVYYPYAECPVGYSVLSGGSDAGTGGSDGVHAVWNAIVAPASTQDHLTILAVCGSIS